MAVVTAAIEEGSEQTDRLCHAYIGRRTTLLLAKLVSSAILAMGENNLHFPQLLLPPPVQSDASALSLCVY